MKRGHLFELTLVLAILVLACLLYVLTATATPSVTSWSNTTGWSPDYITVGSNDTLYMFKDNGVPTGVRNLTQTTRGNEIRAIGSNGSLLWSLEISPEWSVLNEYDLPGYAPEGYGYFLPAYPVLTESGGSLYVFAFKRLTWEQINSVLYENKSEFTIIYNNTTNIFSRSTDQYLRQPGKVLKISPEGNIEWEYTFNMTLPKGGIGGLCDPAYFSFDRPVKISEEAGRVYVFHDYAEDVLDQGGRLLFSIGNISDPAVIDSTGRIYTITGTKLEITEDTIMAANGQPLEAESADWYLMKAMGDPDTLLPTGVVEARDSDGKFLWSMDVGKPAIRPLFRYDVWSKYYSLPLCANGTLYVPVRNGIIAVSPEGKVEWSYSASNGSHVLYEPMPLDSRGVVYLRTAYLSDTMYSNLKLSCLTIVKPDGSIGSDAWPFYQADPVVDQADAPLVVGGFDGILYATGVSHGAGMSAIPGEDFEKIYSTKRYPADTLTAYDVKNGTVSWHFTIPRTDIRSVRLTRENAGEALMHSADIGDLTGYGFDYGTWNASTVPLTPYSTNVIRVHPGGNVVYLDYYYSVVEAPLIVGRSRCVYAKGLYALDTSGKLLWEQPVDGFVRSAAVNNSTIYYQTSDGTIGKGTVNIGAGIALAALVYLVLRFFVLGTVSRAKGRIDRNENRNQVLDYITAHPASTAYDIARGLGMNLGTLRYHLLILSANHRIVTHSDGNKYVRYFKNSGSYTPEERSLHSLMRREPVRKTLKVLMEKPGISGSELSRELKVSDTAAYRHVNLLVEKGIVIKGACGDRGTGYSIKAEYRSYVARMSERQ